jgi:predicted permease
MRKNPLFVLFVVLTLALGIGANTTVFTVINTLILNPLPVSNAATLAAVSATKAKSTTQANVPRSLSYADFKDYRQRNSVFSSFAAYTSPHGVTLDSGNGTQGMFTELVTGNYFSTLGLRPAKGRFFLPEEDGAPGAHPVAVLNYGTWATRFGSSPNILGKTLRINDIVFTVVGVAPPQFIGMNAIFGPDVWIPAAMTEQLFPNTMAAALHDRTQSAFLSVGRLKSGVTEAQAQANLTTVADGLAREYAATDAGHSVTVQPVRDVLFTSSFGATTPVLFASAGLLMVVAIVLLIACSNVANLLLARSAGRQQEMAVRVALGANRPRLIRQLLTESLLLGLLSGVVGFGIGYAGLRLLFAALPAGANFVAPKMDGTVFLFALGISLLTGFLFGILPAFQSSRAGVADTLKEGSRTAGKSRRKVTWANGLLVGQVAFSFLLLVLAALFLRSIQRAYNIDPGFQIAHLAIFMTNPGQAGYRKAQTKAFYQEVTQRVAQMPGVTSLAWASHIPLWTDPVNGLEVEGRQRQSAADQLATIATTIDGDYFGTAGVAVAAGRALNSGDQQTTTAVAMVNEKLAHDFWPQSTAIGKRIRMPGETQWREIVGVAKNANYTHWGEPPQRCVFLPFTQSYSDGMVLYVRSKSDPREILTPIQQTIHSAGPHILMGSARTGREIVNGGLFQAKMGVTLLSVFGFLALTLASIGLYGIMAYSVNQRRREIGLRMALGATDGTVLRLILRQGMALVLTGVVLGVAAALPVGRLLSGMLFGLSTTDPLSILSAAGILLMVAFLACYLPARWASRVDPSVALREA